LEGIHETLQDLILICLASQVVIVCQNGKPMSGAFDGWRTLLLTDSKREDGFRRLLEAGGATVLADKYAASLII